MAAIDGLLNLMAQQNATRLILRSDQPPRLLRGAERLRLTMPTTDHNTLLALLGGLYQEQSTTLFDEGEAHALHRHVRLGEVAVELRRIGEDDVEAIFTPAGQSKRAKVAAPAGGAGPVAVTASSGGVASVAAPSVAAPSRLLRSDPALTSALEEAALMGASDLHLSASRAPMVRLHGRLRAMDRPHLDPAELLSPAQRTWIEAGHAMDTSVALHNGRARINIFASHGGLAMACRLLRAQPPSLELLGLPGAVRGLLEQPHGLIIVCGPTGSGKSTTLASFAQEVLRRSPRLLITLEDPIEYQIPTLHPDSIAYQRQIGAHARSFDSGLRDALREDPDVLLVGEMRDAETISLAMTAAETGHLVLATLHSRTAASAVERIVDTYPPGRQRQIRVQLADALVAVVAQRLLPRVDGQGRAVASELLLINHGAASIIRDGKTAQLDTVIQSGGEQGMETLARSLSRLVRSGTVGLEDARGAMADPGPLMELLQRRY